MARTDIANANTQAKITSLAVEVYNGSSWIDLTNPAGSSFPGKSRVKALSFRYADGRWRAQATIINTQDFRAANESLDPGHTSIFNPSGVPLLGAYHDVRIKIGKGGGAAGMVFQGFVGPGDLTSGEDVEMEDYITVDFYGIMQPYFDYYIDKENGREYTDTYLSASTNVLNQILEDYGFNPVIVVQDDPSYYVKRYPIGDTSIGDAITRPVNSIGYVLMEKYNATAGEFRPTVVDPQRSNTTPDIDLGGNIRTTRLTYTEANVRTWVRVIYTDRTTGKQAHVDSKDDSAKAKYGVPDGSGGRLHRYMRIVEKDGSWIDTRAEAQNECDAALWDLSAPCPGAEVAIPWLVLGVEGGDLVRVTTATETIDIGVTEIEWTISSPEDVMGSTVIRGTVGRRVGAARYWFNRGRTDWVGRQDRDRDDLHGATPGPPTEIEAVGLWGDNEDGSPAPVLHVRWHGTRDWVAKGYRVRYRELTLSDSGTATGGSTTSLQDTSKAWGADQWRGFYVALQGSGRKGTNVIRKILSNTATEITAEDAWDDAPAVGEVYLILEPNSDYNVVSVDKYPYIQVPGLKEGAYIMAEVATVPRGIER